MHVVTCAQINIKPNKLTFLSSTCIFLYTVVRQKKKHQL